MVLTGLEQSTLWIDQDAADEKGLDDLIRTFEKKFGQRGRYSDIDWRRDVVLAALIEHNSLPRLHPGE